MSEKEEVDVSGVKYTLAVIARDCAENLDRLLSNYGKYPDEIVVVNTAESLLEKGAKETDEVALKHGAKVHHFPWVHDFSAARNESFKHASHPWVMWLDSDDTVENPEVVDAKTRFAIATGTINALVMEYLYEFDEQGNCTLMLDRERVVKKEEFEWRAPIHEVLCAKVKLDSTRLPPELGRVIHDRKQGDMASQQKSLKRNLRVFREQFDKKQKQPELRMLFYYGNTLLGLGDFSGAEEKYKTYLERSIEQKSFNPGEQQVACWSCSEALRQQNKYEDAFDYATRAIIINPNTPTAYLHAARALLGMGDYERCVQYAVACKEKAKFIKDEMVSSPAGILGFPDLLMAQILCIKGDWKGAVPHLDIARQYFGHTKEFAEVDEWVTAMTEHEADKDAFRRVTEKMLGERKFKAVQNLALNAPANLPDTLEVARLLPKKRPENRRSIAFLCGDSMPGFTWGPWSIAQGIGGSEEAVINISRELAKLGWHVEVYCPNGKQRKESPYLDQGVEWWPAHCWTGKFDNKIDVVVWWRGPQAARVVAHNSTLNYCWLHDIPMPNVWRENAASYYDGVFVLSQFHRECHAVVPDDKIIMSENGLDPELFVPLEACTNIPTKMIWGSDPSRGVPLILPHWKRIKEAVPEAEWHIYYGWSPHFLGDVKRLAWAKNIYDYVEANKDQPGIHWHGKVGQFELAQAYASSGVWGYPTDFPEIHCITGMKAQAHGCIPVVVDDFALKETVQYGYKLPGPMKEAANIERWVGAVIDAMRNPWPKERRMEMATWARSHTWESVARKWAAIFEARLASKASPTPSLSLTTTS